MNLEQRIDAFAKLGEFLKQFSTIKIEKVDDSEFNTLFFDAFEMQINRAHEFNGWFNKPNVLKAFESWSEALSIENLKKWTSNYTFNEDITPKNVAIIMAGNIPLVGFHDFLSVLISGHQVIAKQSSNDKHFLPLIAKFLEYYNPEFKNKITFTEGKLTDFDAVIATGSNNTARYFEHYFGKYPNIIRKNRNSIAILTGKETQEELEGLGEDIFQYFGLGCRSVSKIYIPENYNFELLFNALYKYNDIINYKKYENNYDYNKAVYLMSLFKLQENGFIMLKEDESFSSPIATLFYEYYDSFKILTEKLALEKDKIQCIACNENSVNFVKLGQTQHPELSDYADGIDTLEFLLNI
ncbi:acyl-CoA reductase [uncultured Lutibacter sp.]|uniref:acyl-CoA reductase n=1 Tax=uncultured Lutibacter sp. TaxID=437739 RepID=UPI002611276E|nr:acyl-CoA reductase [uncultured Lutibacter sp.]